MRVGADALVFNPAGLVLLVRRADDGLWAMPGGWVDPGETPAQAAVREVSEETGLVVENPRLVETTSRGSTRHLTFACDLVGGEIRPSPESLEVGFRDPETIREWHRDHKERVAAAIASRMRTIEPSR